MLEEFLQTVKDNNESKYSALLFNLYEDETAYTMEAVYGEDDKLIGREQPFVICGKECSWEQVLKKVGVELKEYFKEQKDSFKNLKEISYGFVDGDLLYVKKPRKKKEQIRFVKEDFYDMPGDKLEAWLIVYLREDAQKKYQEERWNTNFRHLSEEKFQYWCEILADNFDYKKYGK